jgi:hypothetical protein
MTDLAGGRFFANAACSHYTAEPVTTVDGQRVGYLCPDCDLQLEANWQWQAAVAVSPSAFGGVGAYWAEVDDAIHNGHTARECPTRVEVTRMRDSSPRYVHGNCAPEPGIEADDA